MEERRNLAGFRCLLFFCGFFVMLGAWNHKNDFFYWMEMRFCIERGMRFRKR